MTTQRKLNDDVKQCKLQLGALTSNLLSNAFTFGGAAWTLTGATVVADVAPGPDGRTGVYAADRIKETAANSAHSSGQTLSINVSLARQFSVWVKQDVGARFAHIRMRNQAQTRIIAAIFDLAAATYVLDNVGAVDFFLTPSIQLCEDGWCHLSIGGVLNGAGGVETGAVRVALHNGSSDVYAGDNASSILAWNAILANIT